ncbi:hypothetical protein SAMN04488032_11530 [Pacificibacter marinus]|uniref:Uncharacterized protein n=1 Tax=Pacificibacter marinus TaxID=658057 RepID=A0A1Y5TPT2_9RHOB|nr:hypothetical protein SAMN04488032_11530 [Pacificibacter marinus]SLN65269.1 hypothetical protein PAM7971_03434 [Pacificibacter marinus]
MLRFVYVHARRSIFAETMPALRDKTAVQYTDLNGIYLFQPIPIIFIAPDKRYLKAFAVWIMKSLKAAMRAISLRPFREITHRSWYRCVGS